MWVKCLVRSGIALLFFLPVHAFSVEPIIIGLDADMSSGSAKSGISIKRGVEIALDEINGNGGLLGRPVELVVRDHRGNPARGHDNILAFAEMKNLVAVIGGLHTPVALHELEALHKHKIIYLGPWAAGTNIVENGYNPNYVFRVSVRDEYAGGFLVRKALEKNYHKIGLALENTSWGRSNETAMRVALKENGLEPADVQWFPWGSSNMSRLLKALKSAGSDVILLVANAPEGQRIVRAMAALPEEDRVEIISHWGITGGDFYNQVVPHLNKVSLSFLQTYSFLKPPFQERANKLSRAYIAKYSDAFDIEDIFAPAGTAHAYDLVQLLGAAIRQAESIDRDAVRSALENLPPYRGLIRDYRQAFSPDNHDALDVSDFHLARFRADGTILVE